MSLKLHATIAFFLCLFTATHADPPAIRKVDIYFFHPAHESVKNPLGLVPVKYGVAASSPATLALEGLLGGPMQPELDKGFKPLDTDGLFLQSLKNNKGTWHVRFASKGSKTWPGTLSPARFKMAVEKTMKQFSTVKKVVVYVNGRTDFASGKG